jgi:triosephosphate isomerase (TIM)
MRTPLVVGNWKMNTLRDEAERLVRSMLPTLGALPGLEIVLCPPLPWLTVVGDLLGDSGVRLGAQNFHYQDGGALTGEVSARMLKGVCDYALVGQYERRILLGEKESIVQRKLAAAQRSGLKPILCVGETADQLDEGAGPYVVAQQLEADLEGLAVDSRLVIAYEPVWTTIGMVTAPPLSYVDDMARLIRETLAGLFAAAAAEEVRVIYGGSVTPSNVAEIAAQPHLDGVLAGAGSVNADSFTAIARAFARQL